jgi:hypothetical protein
MNILTIKNIQNDLYRIVPLIPGTNNQNMNQKEFTFDNESPVKKALTIRRGLEGRYLGNTLKEIHEERNR